MAAWMGNEEEDGEGGNEGLVIWWMRASIETPLEEWSSHIHLQRSSRVLRSLDGK